MGLALILAAAAYALAPAICFPQWREPIRDDSSLMHIRGSGDRPSFRRRYDGSLFLNAFDLIELTSNDLRCRPTRDKSLCD
jgi:hypothetical protein